MRTQAEIDALLKGLSPKEMADMLVLLDELDTRKRVALAQNDFLAFIAAVDPTYKFGTHLKRLGGLLMGVELGSHDRIAVSMAPRFGKSQMISIYYPAWYLGKHPDHKVIVASHTADLAVDMARKVRNLMQTAEYRQIFPEVAIAADAKAAGKWNTNKGGEYYAVGTGGALAGRGGHLIIVDDPLSEQDIKAGNTDSLDVTYEWYRSGLRTRLMPGGKICILHTRWSLRDVIGRLIKDAALNPDADQYEVFEFPAILHENTDSEKSLWPEQWSLESLRRTKASMPAWQWNAQYQQNPTAQESAILKSDWIKWWKKDNPPACDFIVQAWDTALTTKERSDYSVCQTWGVWNDESNGSTNVILLNRVKGKWEFPDLKQVAHDQFAEWQPDSVIIEAKASGQPLIDEMRRSGIFVQDFSPGKGQDKMARVNAVTDMFSSGQVWFPETRWATEVVEEILAFPAAEHDDECLVADTGILMADGIEKPIQDVRAGEYVATPFGPRRVLMATPTGVKPVFTRVGLTGTANHPVATSRGWVPLIDITRDDTIIDVSNFMDTSSWLSQQNPELLLTPLSSMGTSTTGTPSRLTKLTSGTTPARAASHYTGLFGSSTTGRFLMGTTYTTKTATTSTTILATWSACVSTHTPRSIKKLGLLLGVLNPIGRIWTALALPQQSGIGLKKGALGIVSTLKRLWRKLGTHLDPSVRMIVSAKNAVNPLRPSLSGRTIAANLAGLNTTTEYSAHGLWNLGPITSVSTVGSSSLRPPQFKSTALPNVKMPQNPANARQVFNLSVEGAECYFANGVLVHNCDTMTLALMRIRRGGLVQLHTDHEDNDVFRRQRTAYY